MTYHIDRYFVDNPEEKRFTATMSESDKELLLKAERFGYITLRRPFKDVVTYTDEQLVQAKMWEEKGCLE